MNDKRFHELLNEYLDGELSGEDRIVFKKALQESSRYRMILRQQERLLAAQTLAVMQKPRLKFSFFPIGRICRSGALLMNAAVLFLSVSLFQAREPLAVDISTPSLSPVATPLTGGAGSDEGRAVSLVSPRINAGNLMDVDGSAGGIAEPGVTSVGNAIAELADLGGTGLAEEYGFVRL